MTSAGGDDSELAGPLEGRGAFPERLSARVVTPGHRPRVHGYDVEADLAKHYAPHDLLFLSLTGDLPGPRESAAFGVVLTFVAPVSVAHASTHAALLSHLCGATTTATAGVAAVGLAEQARLLVAEHLELFEWLELGRAALPERFFARSADEVESVGHLRDALESVGFRSSVLDEPLCVRAAPLAVLHELGIRRAEQLITVLVTTRLPVAMAEALAGRPVDFKHYPINLPRFRYEAS